jgi:hypothetical protein
LAACIAVMLNGADLVSVMLLILVSPLSASKLAATLAAASLMENEVTLLLACSDAAWDTGTWTVLIGGVLSGGG